MTQTRRVHHPEDCRANFAGLVSFASLILGRSAAVPQPRIVQRRANDDTRRHGTALSSPAPTGLAHPARLSGPSPTFSDMTTRGGFKQLSPAALSVWGKSPLEPDGLPMPLVQHLGDSADVAGLVWDWLPLLTRCRIEAALPEGARDGRTLLRWLAGIHDIGKCSPPFAWKRQDLALPMADHGLVVPTVHTDFERAQHGVVGQVVLTAWLREHYAFSLVAATTYAVVVGGHHGVPPTQVAISLVRTSRRLRGDGKWAEVQAEILAAVAERTGADELLPRWAGCPLPPTVQAVLTGAVIVSDWLASNPELFPFGAEAQETRAERAWRDLELPSPWHAALPSENSSHHLAARFTQLAGLDPRPVQQLALDAAWAAPGPALMIVEAAMGTGKTEAALLATEVLAARFGCGGVYVALPTMATSDAMFDRVQGWIANLDGEGATSTYLAHGKHGLNERFTELVRQSRAHDVRDDDAGDPHVEAQVLSWLSGRKKGVLANMVVGTIDQLLFMSLQARHVALRHLAFAGKVVVVDEAHAADDYMREYLVRALEWLASYGVPVVILSATLPWGQRQQLADGYRRGLGLPSLPVQADIAYPSITTVSGEEIDVRQTGPQASGPATSVAVRCLGDDLDELTTLLGDLLRDGGCAAVLRNTVGRAQAAAVHLRDALPEVEVVLVHSRFVATHRAHLEANLRTRLGPEARGARGPLIVVGTQVLEQSLDVDFDVMVTDLAPVDLVLQRTGRLQRHQRGDGESERPSSLRSPRLFVTGIESWREDGLPEPVAGSRRVYGVSRLFRAAAVLGLSPDADTALTLPDAIRPLVERGYAAGPPGPVSAHDAIARADADHAAKVGEQRAKADQFRMAGPDDLDDDNLVGWLAYGDGTEAEDPRSPGASRVRDSDDGIEVIVVERTEDGTVVHLHDDGPHSGKLAVPFHGPPENYVAKALAACTVRLPLSLTANPATFDKTLAELEADVHEGWQESRWLQSQLALHLDADWTTTLAGHRIAYDSWLGLTAVRIDD